MLFIEAGILPGADDRQLASLGELRRGLDVGNQGGVEGVGIFIAQVQRQIGFVGDINIDGDYQGAQHWQHVQYRPAKPGNWRAGVCQHQHQQVDVHHAVEHDGVNGSRGDEQVNAAHRQGEQHQRRNQQHQIQRVAFLSLYPDNQQNGRGKPQKPVQHPGKLRGNQGEGAACKDGEEGAVGLQGIGGQGQGREGQATRGIASHFLMGQGQSQLCKAVVEPQRQGQEENVAQAVPEHRFSVLSVQQAADNNGHQKPGA